MKKYETMFILKPDMEEENIEAAILGFRDLITGGGGTVADVNKWGKRRLAYEIQGYEEGIYVIINFSAESAVAQELERVFKITDAILRYLLIRED
ncbi:MAG: 30S ribosomal protein S6 [Firmicutes bacterium]|nr:30S ribosomal protein S6 [Bacillota bacterium]